MSNAYTILLYIIMFLLAAGIFFALLRAIRGPRIADRILGINMIGTLSLLIIASTAILYKESWLLDVSMIYAIISFLAVVVLSSIRVSLKLNEKKAPDKE